MRTLVACPEPPDREPAWLSVGGVLPPSGGVIVNMTSSAESVVSYTAAAGVPMSPASGGGDRDRKVIAMEAVKEEAQPVKPGDAVLVVDENYRRHVGLVTTVHGTFTDTFAPCINVVYVSDDPAKRDPYGQQLERLSSLQHYSQGPSQMPRPGRYWTNL